jgi:hypothetical protein
MSRIPGGEQIQVRPTNNVYTALAAVAMLVQLLGLIVLYIRANDIGGLF